MTRTLVAVVALLALPAGAIAKEIQQAAVCGPDGCQAVQDKQRMDVVLGSGGPPTSPPSRHAPFYRVKVSIKGDPERLRLIVAPSVGRVRGFDGHWFAMPRSNRALWRHFLRGVRPFPASRLPGVQPLAAPSPPPAATPARVRDEHGFPWWIAALLAALGLGIGFAALFRPNSTEGDTHGSSRRQGGDRHRLGARYWPRHG